VVYLSGRFVAAAEATVPVTDRGFLFGDGVYEVYRLYRGRPFRVPEHVERLRRSAEAIRLPLPEVDWVALGRELVARNGLEASDATVYLQVTRGAPARRSHAFPPTGTAPTVLAMAQAFRSGAPDAAEAGVRVVTAPDVRWGRCDIKSTNLLPNILAHQAAVEAGATEAVFVRDGVVTEGTHTNVLGMVDGQIRTHPEGPRILSGVTRAAVLEVARSEGLPVEERALALQDLERASEVWLVGTTTEITSVVRIDGRVVGDGRSGPVARRLRATFRRLVCE
jgi:D-alanine transaminase